MNSIRTRLKLRAIETRRYWWLRSRSQRLGTNLSSARIAMAAHVADFSALIRIGGRALSRSAVLILPPLLALVAPVHQSRQWTRASFGRHASELDRTIPYLAHFSPLRLV